VKLLGNAHRAAKHPEDFAAKRLLVAGLHPDRQEAHLFGGQAGDATAAMEDQVEQEEIGFQLGELFTRGATLESGEERQLAAGGEVVVAARLAVESLLEVGHGCLHGPVVGEPQPGADQVRR
jgi:hypothetical protein